MINQKEFYDCLQSAGVEFMAGVPDSLLNDFCNHAELHMRQDQHVIAANEGNAVALAVGYHLSTGSVPLVYMQNSGIGNALNPLLSLTNKEVYSIPLVLLIGWRGDPFINDHAQHTAQGALTPNLLEAMNIPYHVLDDHPDRALESASWAVRTARALSSPVALLAKKGVLAQVNKQQSEDAYSTDKMSREQAIDCIMDSVPKDAIFVATTGRATRELYALRELKGLGHERDFLNVGAMGHTSSVALGIAVASKDKFVVCLDGDASAIMHLGSLATVGKLDPHNFLHIVLNNGAHESVGGQASAGFKINMTAIAENAGYQTMGEPINTKKDLQSAIKTLNLEKKPAFIDARIRKGIRQDLPPLSISHADLKKKFMISIGSTTRDMEG